MMMDNELVDDPTNQWDESANNEENGGLILSDEDDEVFNLEEGQHEASNAIDRSMLLMKFCPHDSSMLYPREHKASRTLQYACRLCNYSEPSPHSSMIYRNILVKEAKNALHTVPGNVSDDPTLPRSHDAECSNCGHNEAVFFQSDTGQSGSLSLIYVCCNCGHKWVDSQKEKDEGGEEQGFE